MNIITGELVEIFVADGTTMGKVSVRGAYMNVPLTFLMSAKAGDTVVIESGIAISVSEKEHTTEL
jgi:hydrogenase maturation factor